MSYFKGASRIFLLTKKNFVLADQKTGQLKASVPLPDLASVSVSTQNDGFFALKLKEVKSPDTICFCTVTHIKYDVQGNPQPEAH